MKYIIDPMWFYWINVADTARTMLWVFVVFCGVVTIVSGFVAVILSDDKDGEDFKTSKKIVLITLPITLIVSMLLVFFPSKSTMIEMQIAKYATFENAEWTVDAIKNAVDYIVQAIQSIK